MLDFRYHALSLMAVFLALAIGIVLGVTIGDSLLTDAKRSLRTDLQGTVVEARQQAAKAQSQVAGRDRMLDQLYPGLVRDRLRDQRVALVSWGPLPDGVEGNVRDAVNAAGATLDSVSVIDKVLSDLELAVGRDRFATLTADQGTLQGLGQSLADGLVGTNGLGRRLRQLLPDAYKGLFKSVNTVVFYEAPPPADDTGDAGAKERTDSRARTIETAMLDELKSRTLTVVGVEGANAEPSQIPRYQSLHLSSVDSVDTSGGKIALVYALAGPSGTFGLKPSAQRPLPDTAVP
jgi:hypothetical protein